MPAARRSFTARIGLLTALLCGAAGFPGCGVQSLSVAGGPGQNPPPASATISLCASGSPGCTAASSFSVASLRDLSVSVQWNNVPAGNHVQNLEFFLPSGGLYQSVETSFLIASSPVGSTTMTGALPVAGTWITQRSLTGNWKVQVSLDGKATASQTVALNP